jgi:hypothetical protein
VYAYDASTQAAWAMQNGAALYFQLNAILFADVFHHVVARYTEGRDII